MLATRLLSSAIATAILLAYAPHASAQTTAADPPNRVARLAYQTGDVQFAASGEDNWGSADVNRPLVTGDRLETGRDGRAALELGQASVRLKDDSALNLLELDSDVAQFELSQGTLNMRVRRVDEGQTYEVDTPTVAFVAERAGSYRVDIDPDHTGSMVTVFTGSGTVYGENGVSKPVTAGHSYRIDDSRLASVTVRRLPEPDAFDRFSTSRDGRYERSISRRYVSEDVIGYEDLDGYGDWSASADYGEVWYPTRVARDWAPYHDGHWAWVDPWGWTWVDNAPWGFAPSHYGRWAYIGNRWGWLPCRSRERSIYAPALVAFVGGSHFSIGINIGGGEPVGWFPLGPRDVYQPPYRVTQDYFTNINVTNVRVVNNTTIINNTYNNYITNSPGSSITYNNRNVPGAVTVVPRNVFTGARPVAGAAMKINPKDLAQAQVTPILRVAPNAGSLGVRPGSRPAGVPVQRFEGGPIFAHHAPPAVAAPFAERIKAIGNQGGAPLAPEQLNTLRQSHANQMHAPQRVVMAAPGGSAINSPARHENRLPPNAAPGATGPALHDNPITVPAAAAGERPMRTGELPSARFAHPHAGGQAPTNQSANPLAPNSGPGMQRPSSATTMPANGAWANTVHPMQPSHTPAMDNVRQAQQRDSIRSPRANDASAQDATDGQAADQPRMQHHTPRAEPMQDVVRAPREQQAPIEQPRMQHQTPRAEPMQDVVRAPREQQAPVEQPQPRVIREPMQRHELPAQRIEPQQIEPRAPRMQPEPRPQIQPQQQPPRRDAPQVDSLRSQAPRAQDAQQRMPRAERPVKDEPTEKKPKDEQDQDQH